MKPLLFKTIAFLITLSSLPATALAAPTSNPNPSPSSHEIHEIKARQQQCTSPKLRKEWSKATRAEQQSYIDAALCLATKPSRLGLNTTLYDDFGWIHGILFGESKYLPTYIPYLIDISPFLFQICTYCE
jgi:hypothetical protein